MKHIILIFLLGFTALLASSQQMKFDWISQAGGPDWDIVTAMNELPNGELAMVGTYYESISFYNDTLFSNGSRDVFIARFSTNGELKQVASLGGTGYDYAKSVENDSENGLIIPVKFYDELEITGKKFGKDLANNILISWFDESLTLTKSFQVSSTKEFDVTDLKSLPDGSCFFTGWFSDSLKVDHNIYISLDEKDAFMGKIAPNGELEWFKHLTGQGDDVIKSTSLTDDGKQVIFGTTSNGCFEEDNNSETKSGSNIHLFVARVDAKGDLLSVRYPLSGSEIVPVDMVADSTSIWILADVKNTVFKADGSKILPYGKGDVLLLQFDLKNETINHCQIAGAGNDASNGMIKSGENILVTGHFSGEMNFGLNTAEAAERGTDVFIAMVDKNCNPENLFTLTGESSEFPCSVFASQSGVYVTGEFTGNLKSDDTELVSAGKEDIFLARVENCGARNPLSIKTSLFEDDPSGNVWELNAGSSFVNYSWNDGLSNSQYFITNQPGKYSVTVTDFFGCTYTQEIEISLQKSATLKEEITERAFKLYPTVTSDFIYWEPSSLWDNQKAVVTVFDASGRSILQQEHQQVIPQSYRIDLSAESEGTYLIDISGDDFQEVTKVMVKN